MLIDDRIFVTCLFVSTAIIFILSLFVTTQFRLFVNKIVEKTDSEFLQMADQYLDQKYIFDFYTKQSNTIRLTDTIRRGNKLQNKRGFIATYRIYRLNKKVKNLQDQAIEYAKACKIKDKDYIYNLILY